MKWNCKKEMALFLTMLALAGCGKEAPPPETGKVPVVVSFGAMEKLTEAIGGDAVSITVMVPEGTEPHDFEPRAVDLVKLKQAKVFVYNGMGMEHWANKALQSAGSDNLVTVNASKHISPILLEDEEEIEEHGSYAPPHLAGPLGSQRRGPCHPGRPHHRLPGKQGPLHEKLRNLRRRYRQLAGRIQD